MSEHVAGTIKVEWSIDERGLGIADIKRELTASELRALYDRIEEAVIGAIGGDYADVFLDGEDKPPVRVHLDMCAGMNELEIDDGPVNGRIEDLRGELPEECGPGSPCCEPGCDECPEGAPEGEEDEAQS